MFSRHAGASSRAGGRAWGSCGIPGAGVVGWVCGDCSRAWERADGPRAARTVPKGRSRAGAKGPDRPRGNARAAGPTTAVGHETRARGVFRVETLAARDAGRGERKPPGGPGGGAPVGVAGGNAPAGGQGGSAPTSRSEATRATRPRPHADGGLRWSASTARPGGGLPAGRRNVVAPGAEGGRGSEVQAVRRLAASGSPVLYAIQWIT